MSDEIIHDEVRVTDAEKPSEVINGITVAYYLPPDWVYKPCQEKFGADFSRTVFTVGNTIYARKPLTQDIFAHESVHVQQQAQIGGGYKQWWKLYLESPEFRATQEIPAYQVQYAVYCRAVKDRNARARMLHFVASTLSGKLYGNIMTLSEAKKEIQNYVLK
jgi:hypothetical protein